MTADKAILEVSNVIAKDVRELIDSMRPPKPSTTRLRVGIFLTIAEQFEASLLLAYGGMASHAAVHVRGMLEGLIAMNLLEKNHNHVDQIMFNQSKGEKKIYEGMLKDEEIYGEFKESIEEKLNACKLRYDRLHANGLRPQQIADQFKAAELKHLIVPYLALCGFSHNDIGVITMRHQRDDSMTYMAVVKSEVIVTIFQTALMILMTAVEQLPRIAQFPNELFESIFARMNDVWGVFMRDHNKPDSI